MSTRSRLLKTAAVTTAALAGVAWAGLRTPVPPLPLAVGARSTEKVPVPPDLPAPVARYFAITAGESVPLARSPRVTGTVRMRVPGLPLPLWMNGRWNATYEPGKAFTRIMELGFFGNIVLRGVDEYRDGIGSVTVGDKRDAGPNCDQAADLVMWAESVWMPSILFTTPGVRWQAVDDSKARMLVPFGPREHELTWHFDPTTGLLAQISSFRYKTTTDAWRTPWHVDIEQYNVFEKITVPSSLSITWEDDGHPWAVFNVLDLTFEAADSPTQLNDATQRLQST